MPRGVLLPRQSFTTHHSTSKCNAWPLKSSRTRYQTKVSRAVVELSGCPPVLTRCRILQCVCHSFGSWQPLFPRNPVSCAKIEVEEAEGEPDEDEPAPVVGFKEPDPEPEKDPENWRFDPLRWHPALGIQILNAVPQTMGARVGIDGSIEILQVCVGGMRL